MRCIFAYHVRILLYVNANRSAAPGAGPSCSQHYVDETHGESGDTDESVSLELSFGPSTRHSLFCILRTRTPTSPVDTRALTCHSHIARSMGPTSRFQPTSRHTYPPKPPTGTMTTSRRAHGHSRFHSPPLTPTRRRPNATSPHRRSQI